MKTLDVMERSATISEDGLYRYDLTRTWGSSDARAVWVMLNPSTADGEVDDPTIRRCVGFTKNFGLGSLVVVNLYALRCTKPEHLDHHPDPAGPLNHETIARAIDDPATYIIIAAWGAHSARVAPPTDVLEICRLLGMSICCLGQNRDRSPKHPLYVPASQLPERWTP